MRPDRTFPVPPSAHRPSDAALPLRRFLARRALLLGLRRLGRALARSLGLQRTRVRIEAGSLARLDDRLLRDIGLVRESGPEGDRYRPR